MHRCVTEMCTPVHISVTKWCIVVYGTGAFWDCCNLNHICTMLEHPLTNQSWSLADDIHTLSFGLALEWRNNERDGISNHQLVDGLLERLFRSKKTSKLRVTGLCEGNSPMAGEFPSQRASDAENVSIWWRHHGFHWGKFHEDNKSAMVCGI